MVRFEHCRYELFWFKGFMVSAWLGLNFKIFKHFGLKEFEFETPKSNQTELN